MKPNDNERHLLCDMSQRNSVTTEEIEALCKVMNVQINRSIERDGMCKVCLSHDAFVFPAGVGASWAKDATYPMSRTGVYATELEACWMRYCLKLEACKGETS